MTIYSQRDGGWWVCGAHSSTLPSTLSRRSLPCPHLRALPCPHLSPRRSHLTSFLTFPCVVSALRRESPLFLFREFLAFRGGFQLGSITVEFRRSTSDSIARVCSWCLRSAFIFRTPQLRGKQHIRRFPSSAHPVLIACVPSLSHHVPS